MFGTNEGPTYIEPPKPASYYDCYGCKYLKDSLLSHSFRDGSVYSYSCKHPDVEDDFGPKRLDKDEQSVFNFDPMRHISDISTRTPDWCPILLKEKAKALSAWDNPETYGPSA